MKKLIRFESKLLIKGVHLMNLEKKNV